MSRIRRWFFASSRVSSSPAASVQSPHPMVRACGWNIYVSASSGRSGSAAPRSVMTTRSPSFWRREFARAGFVLERQIFDAATIEFQMFVAPPGWMPVLSRLLEPLRIIPGINLVLCDRVKFRLLKQGRTTDRPQSVSPCCPICYKTLAEDCRTVLCAGGHRFARDSLGLIDFTTLARDETAGASVVAEQPSEIAPVQRSVPKRRWRRGALLVLSAGYGGLLLPLLPLGLIVRIFYQPFRQQRSS